MAFIVLVKKVEFMGVQQTTIGSVTQTRLVIGPVRPGTSTNILSEKVRKAFKSPKFPNTNKSPPVASGDRGGSEAAKQREQTQLHLFQKVESVLPCGVVKP